MLRISDIFNKEKQKSKTPPAAETNKPSSPSADKGFSYREKEEPSSVRFSNSETGLDLSKRKESADLLYQELLQCVILLFEKARAQEPIPIQQAFDLASRIPDVCLGDSDIVMSFVEKHSQENYLYSHSIGVGVLAWYLGVRLGLDDVAAGDLLLAGILHDIGMAGMPESLSGLPRGLSLDERRIIRQHPLKSLEHLKNFSQLSRYLLDAIIAHHERADASGYPRALNGEQIPFSAKILGICDVYMALTHPRSYRKSFSPAHSIKIIVEESHKNFDDKAVRAMLDVLSLYPRMSLVKLNTNETALVEHVNARSPLRPVVLVTHDASSVPLANPRRLDLSTQTLISIKELAHSEGE